MQNLYHQAKQKRQFVPVDLEIQKWEDILPFFEELLHEHISTRQESEQWLIKRSELEAVIEEEMAWLYIRMSCDTQNSEYSSAFNHFVEHIEPHIAEYSNKLDDTVLELIEKDLIDTQKFHLLIRSLKNRHSVFRKENIPILSELQRMEQEYGSIASKMTITIHEREYTLQQAGLFLKETDRTFREQIFRAIHSRRLEDEAALNNLLSRLIEKRHQCAIQADFENYRDYKLKDLGRFDYTKEDCFAFHTSIQQTIPAAVKKIHKKRKESLSLSVLKPWDLDVDPENKPPVKPFNSAEELVQKTLNCLHEIRPKYASFIKTMADEGYMDLESRIGKAPGGFNYPLYESNIPFIFMNASGSLRDVETLLHESGHAIHSCLTAELPLIEFKSMPSEVAELASMSMELISMEHWHHFFANTEDLNRAKRSQLEQILATLAWVAIVDAFQHWLYENPSHSVEAREASWLQILSLYDTGIIDWSELHHIQKSTWQRQLHIYEVPFYYIEYGIAQLGAIALWKNYKTNPEQTLNSYEKFLTVGYTKTIPEIYAEAGITFSFDKQYIQDLIHFVQSELEEL
ncbi:MAG: M3 family oligoendopeptidase [Bacteroidales bacterium]|jgi:oligoendopeptidase F|nr:M3 family oligoendopeptidase [Bacteroidales bacterium]